MILLNLLLTGLCLALPQWFSQVKRELTQTTLSSTGVTGSSVVVKFSLSVSEFSLCLRWTYNLSSKDLLQGECVSLWSEYQTDIRSSGWELFRLTPNCRNYAEAELTGSLAATLHRDYPRLRSHTSRSTLLYRRVINEVEMASTRQTVSLNRDQCESKHCVRLLPLWEDVVMPFDWFHF